MASYLQKNTEKKKWFSAEADAIDNRVTHSINLQLPASTWSLNQCRDITIKILRHHYRRQNIISIYQYYLQQEAVK